MLKTIVNKFHLFLFLLVLTLLCGIFVVLYSDPLIISEDRRELIKPYEYRGDIDIEFADGTKTQVKMPAVIETDQPFVAVLNLENLGMIDNKTLTFVSKDVLIRCEVDDIVIYRYTLPHANTNYVDGNTMYFIDLPERVDKSVIRLHYENDKPYTTQFELKDIRVGHRINIISHYFLKENVFGILLVILMFVLSLIILSVGIFVKNRMIIEYYFNYIAILCLLVGLYILPQLSISYFVLYRYRVFLHIIEYTVPMIVPMILLCAVKLRTHQDDNWLLLLGILLSAINLITQHALTITNHATLTMMSKYTYAIIAYTFLVCTYAIFNSKGIEETKIKRMAFSLMPLFFGGVMELIIDTFSNTSSLSIVFQSCLFLFFVLQVNEFFRFFIANRDKRLEADLYQKLAMQDKLTGLGNRLAFTKVKEKYLEGDYSFYCVVFDIDNLKYMNDTYGHKYGDLMIIKFAELLTNFFDSSTKSDLYRIGGDEFVVFYHAPKNLNLTPLLEALDLEYTSSSVGLESGMNEYGVSYGYGYYESASDECLDEVLHKADQRMYEQKKHKGICRCYSTSSS